MCIRDRAEILVLPGVSGHADDIGLMRWAGAFREKPPTQVFVTHGDDHVCEFFAKRLEKELGYRAMAPYSGTVYDLKAGEFLEIAEGIPVEKADVYKRQRRECSGKRQCRYVLLRCVLRWEVPDRFRYAYKLQRLSLIHIWLGEMLGTFGYSVKKRRKK